MLNLQIQALGKFYIWKGLKILGFSIVGVGPPTGHNLVDELFEDFEIVLPTRAEADRPWG